MKTPQTKQLLAIADERWREEREKSRVYDAALVESHELIRELYQRLDEKDECLATLEEYAADMTRAARRSA